MKNVFFIIFVIINLISCSDTSDNISDLDSLPEKEVVILKERDPNYPWIPSDYKSFFSSQQYQSINVPGMTNRQFLGYSLKDDIYPLEDTRNLGYRVIDTDKLYADIPSYFTVWKNNTGFAKYFSYANFDRYVVNSSITNNISSGFNLNLGLFSIGNKKSLTTVFTKSLTEDSNATFGELDIILRDSCFRMQYSSNIQSKIKEKYLSKVFEDELYNTHPSEFFSNYGGFVLTNFVVGGKATAQYVGIYNKTESNESKETNMKYEMNASYGFKYDDKDSSLSGDLSFGRNKDGSISVTNEFSSLMMSIKTIGGNSSFASFSIPQEVMNANINLSEWISSLNDKTTHNIVEFGNDGLIPITDFIVEENLKSQINEYYKTGVTQIEKLQEPYISIKIDFWNGKFFVFGTYLHTRFGNTIGLKHKAVAIFEDYNSYIDNEIERVSKIFGVKIINDTPYGGKATKIVVEAFDVDIFNETDLGKFVYDGVVYIVNKQDIKGKKYAFSIHEDRYIDEYVMRNFVDRLPVVNIEYNNLITNYIIYAL